MSNKIMNCVTSIYDKIEKECNVFMDEYKAVVKSLYTDELKTHVRNLIECTNEKPAVIIDPFKNPGTRAGELDICYNLDITLYVENEKDFGVIINGLDLGKDLGFSYKEGIGYIVSERKYTESEVSKDAKSYINNLREAKKLLIVLSENLSKIRKEIADMHERQIMDMLHIEAKLSDDINELRKLDIAASYDIRRV